jgi:hypothetical protein
VTQLKSLIAIAALLLTLQTVKAQNEAPDPAPASSTPWKIGPFDISGTIDAYYSLALNHPDDNLNALRNFDDKAGRIELNMAQLTLDYAPQPVGFHLEVGAGHTFDVVNAAEKDATEMRFFKQAYIDVKPPWWTGLELDFGKFVSSAGAEVIETASNWNYSRSLLFVWCEPYYHFGLRASASIGKHLTAGVQIVDGWNNIVTGATFKTVGLTGSWAPASKLTWSHAYYGGPDGNLGQRKLYDSVFSLTANSKTSFYVNFDYLYDSPRYSPSRQVYGIAGAARRQLSRKIAVASRLEWLDDQAGMATGTGQQVKEFTVTGTYALRGWLSWWLEFRNDWSNQPFFTRGSQTASAKNQPTALLGMVVTIGPKK